MEILWGLVALACPLAMLILPIIALTRASEAKKEAATLALRLGVVERRLKAAEAQLRSSEGSGAVSSPALAPSAPAMEAPSAPAIEAPAPAPPPSPPSMSDVPEAAALAAAPQPDRGDEIAATPEPSSVTEAAKAPPGTTPSAPRPATGAPPPGWTPLSAKGAASVTASTPSTPAPPRGPTAPKAPAFDLERWIGVRGAAVLGGMVLALAGLLLFKYSIDAGLISPSMRVIGGTLAGLGCIVAAQTRWLRPYAITANAIVGGGCAVLYGAFWASGSLYHLVPGGVAFGLMAAVTATCCVLAVRHNSLVIALLGLVGGFLTPLLVSTDVENPLGRFAYILLLDVGLLVLARKKGWTLLATLSLAGTVAYQALWVAADMSPDDLGVGLVILGAFAAVFAFAGRGERGSMRLTQAAALLVPTAFSLYFSLQAPADGDLWAHGLLLILLNGAGAWLSREQEQPLLAVGIAAASLPPVAAWLLHAGADVPAQFQAAVVMLAIAGVHHGLAEFSARKGGSAAGAPVAAVTATLVAALGLGAMPAGSSIWLAEGAALVGAALLLRQARLGDVGSLPVLVAVLLAGTQLLPLVGVHVDPAFPPLWQWLALTAGTAAALHGAALIGDHAPTARAAVWHPLLLLPGLWFCPLDDLRPETLLGGALVLGVLATLAATRRAKGLEVLASLVGVAGVAFVWMVQSGRTALETAPGGAMVLIGLSAAFFTAWPYLAPRRFTGRAAWWASAGAAWAVFLPLYALWDARWGDSAMGLLPVSLAVLPVTALVVLRSTHLTDDLRTSALAWTATAAFGFLSVAVPLQLEQEWITVGWAIEGVAVLFLWRRVDHPGLKYFALTLLAVVGVRLLLNPAVLGYHPRGMRVVNWLAYTYLVPAAAMFVASRLLGGLEARRARPFERSFYGGGAAIFAGALGGLGLAVVFAWMNLAVLDWFATGDRLELDFSRLQARDLTFSIVWAAYSLALLVLGVVRKGKLLRWASLGLMLVTLAKVFLYDLGELDDLYRVASLVGLAISLIGVSLLYQRFVFREEPGGGGEAPTTDEPRPDVDAPTGAPSSEPTPPEAAPADPAAGPPGEDS